MVYAMVYAPALLLQSSGALDLVTTLIVAVVGLTILVALLNNYFFAYNKAWESGLLVLSMASIFSYLFIENMALLVAGVVICLGIFVRQWKASKASREAE